MKLTGFARVAGEDYIRAQFREPNGREFVVWHPYKFDSDGVIYVGNRRPSDPDSIQTVELLNRLLPMYIDSIPTVEAEG